MRTILYVSMMHCEGCARSVENIVRQIPSVTNATVTFHDGRLEIESESPVDRNALDHAVAGKGRWRIVEHAEDVVRYIPLGEKSKQSWNRFFPLVFFFGLATACSFAPYIISGMWSADEWMRAFMTGFFLIFGGMKLINLRKFAASFSGYDIIAGRIFAYGYIYPFIEVALGLAFLFSFFLFYANIMTAIVMSAGVIGIIRALRASGEIQCACLGGFFSVPITWFTVVENGIMVTMALVMLASGHS